MPTCQNPKCQQVFPARLEVDEKIKFLSKRKYCLQCSPFGEHSAWGLDRGHVSLRRSPKRHFICKSCGKSYYQKTRNLECSGCRTQIIRGQNRNKAIASKGGKCCICGYNKYHGSLNFHHNSGEKEHVISQIWQCSWQKIEHELKKCVLVCANCHGEVHGNLAVVPELA